MTRPNPAVIPAAVAWIMFKGKIAPWDGLQPLASVAIKRKSPQRVVGHRGDHRPERVGGDDHHAIDAGPVRDVCLHRNGPIAERGGQRFGSRAAMAVIDDDMCSRAAAPS